MPFLTNLVFMTFNFFSPSPHLRLLTARPAFCAPYLFFFPCQPARPPLQQTIVQTVLSFLLFAPVMPLSPLSRFLSSPTAHGQAIWLPLSSTVQNRKSFSFPPLSPLILAHPFPPFFSLQGLGYRSLSKTVERPFSFDGFAVSGPPLSLSEII